jgi:predicted secreted hydrolase
MSSVIIETVTTDSRNQLTIPYWEGRVKVSGGLNGKGYAELVGY